MDDEDDEDRDEERRCTSWHGHGCDEAYYCRCALSAATHDDHRCACGHTWSERLHYPNELARRAAKGAGYRPHRNAEPSPSPS